MGDGAHNRQRKGLRVSQPIVFRNAHVFDGTEFLPGVNDVIFDGATIAAVGRDAGSATASPMPTSSIAPARQYCPA